MKKYFFLVLLLIIGLLVGVAPLGLATGANWLSGWSYRKSHTINSATGASTNYQINITVYFGSGSDGSYKVYCGSLCKTDFSDVRFTSDDGSSVLAYWLQESISSNYAIFWIKITASLSSNSATIYIYFGNSGASSLSDGYSVFLKFDAFGGSSANSTTWTISSSPPSVSGGIVNCSATQFLQGKTQYGEGYSFIGRFSLSVNHYSQLGWTGADSHPDNAPIFIFQGNYPTANVYNSRTYVTSGITDNLGSGYSGFHVWDLERQDDFNARFQIDHIVVGTDHTSQVPANNLYFTINSEGASSYYTACDWCGIRKFVYPEPTQGSGGNIEGIHLWLVGSTTTKNSINCVFYSNWSSVGANSLSGFIFGWNNSGSFVNDTWIAFSGGHWTNKTKTISQYIGFHLSYEFWVNDSSNLWANTGLQIFLIDGYVIFKYHSFGSVWKNSSYVVNNSQVLYNSKNTHLGLLAVSDWNCTFLNFTWDYGSNRFSNFTFTVVSTVTITAYFENVSILYNLGYSSGYSSGYGVGYSAGYSVGWSLGNASGYSNGYNSGWSLGNASGYSNGYNSGWSVGNSTGYSSGFGVGYSSGVSIGYSNGWLIGNSTGYSSGYSIGYLAGVNSGSHSTVNVNVFWVTLLLACIISFLVGRSRKKKV